MRVTCRDQIAYPAGVHNFEGLDPPILDATGDLVRGADTDKLCLQNKWRCHNLQEEQPQFKLWTKHTGDAILPQPTCERPATWLNEMCPTGIATSHPAGGRLAKWAQLGCPTKTGRPWTKDEIWQAVARGPHQSSRLQDALAHFAKESAAKVTAG
jgi:hypothetical protein